MTGQVEIATLAVDGAWDELLQRPDALAALLPAFLQGRRWFGGKARHVAAAQIVEAVRIPYADAVAYLCLVQVDYRDGPAETYALPLAGAEGERAGWLLEQLPHLVIARFQRAGQREAGVLYDALGEPAFCTALLELIGANRQLHGRMGVLLGSSTRAFTRIVGGAQLQPAIGRAEQSNTSVIYGDRLILKLFRRLEAGINPDLEIGRFLTERRAFAHIPPVAGAIEYRRGAGEPTTVAILQEFVPNQGDAWQYTLGALDQALARAGASEAQQILPLSSRTLLDLAAQEPSSAARELIGSYLDSARVLGQRTAELHLVLAADVDDPAFAPEPFTPAYQQAIYESMCILATQVFQTFRADPRWGQAYPAYDLERQVRERFQPVRDRPIAATRTRFHGDYHLGQVLYTGRDFLIIDFEGEPARPLNERRAKHSPLRDVAGMLRSFHYAAATALRARADRARLEPWARLWNQWVSAAFVKAYLATAGQASFVPRSRDGLQVLLDAYLLEKAIYELGYELNNRPDWVPIPLQGILHLVEAG